MKLSLTLVADFLSDLLPRGYINILDIPKMKNSSLECQTWNLCGHFLGHKLSLSQSSAIIFNKS